MVRLISCQSEHYGAPKVCMGLIYAIMTGLLHYPCSLLHRTDLPGQPTIDLGTNVSHCNMWGNAPTPPAEPAKSAKKNQQHKDSNGHCESRRVGSSYHVPSLWPSETMQLVVACIHDMGGSRRAIRRHHETTDPRGCPGMLSDEPAATHDYVTSSKAVQRPI